MHHAESVDFRSTLAVLLPLRYVTQMFKVVKAAWPMSWLAHGLRDGSSYAVININIMMLFCSNFRRLCLTQATYRPRQGRDPPRTCGQRYSGSLPERSHYPVMLIMDSIHGQDFSKLSLHRQNRVWGSHLLDLRRSLHDQCLISLP